MRRRSCPSALRSCSSALVFAAGTWHWSDVPWSHFFAAFLAVGLYAARFVPPSATVASAGVVGAGCSPPLAHADLRAPGGAAGVGGVARAVRPPAARRPEDDSSRSRAVGRRGLPRDTTAVYLITGKRDLFFLYEGRARQSVGKRPRDGGRRDPDVESRLRPRRSSSSCSSTRAIDSLCSVSDYSGQASQSPLLTEEAGNLRLWRLPLAVQLPSLAPAPRLPRRPSESSSSSLRGARPAGDEGSRAAPAHGADSGVCGDRARVHVEHADGAGTPAVRLRPRLPAARVPQRDRRGRAWLSVGLWLSSSRRTRPARWSPEFTFVMLSFLASAAPRRDVRVRPRERHPANREPPSRPRSRTRRRCDVEMRHLARGEDDQRATRRRYPRRLSSRSTVGTREPRFTIYVERLERGCVARSSVPGSPARRRLADRHGAPTGQLRAGRGRCAKRLARSDATNAPCEVARVAMRAVEEAVSRDERLPRASRACGDGHMLEAKGEVVAGGRSGVPALGGRDRRPAAGRARHAHRLAVTGSPSTHTRHQPGWPATSRTATR